jgi:anti-anti-sigma factor
MELTTEQRADGIERIILAGRMDSAGAEQIGTRFTALTATRPARIVVDMAQVPFLSSLGIRLLVSNAKALRQRGGHMVLASPQPMVREVLEIVGMNTLIPIHSDLDSACAALKAAGQSV